MPQRPLKIKKRDITWNEIARHGQNVGIHNLDIAIVQRVLEVLIGNECVTHKHHYRRTTRRSDRPK